MAVRIKQWARHLKKETTALYFAYRDPRTPWYAKALTLFVVAHTFSPIDLIPDFIPVLGYLDDLIITPLGLVLAVKLIPKEILVEARQKAETQGIDGKSLGKIGLLIVIGIWILLFIVILVIVFQLVDQR